ncbi:hypothetical protein CY0110_15877 [Crocosphaera chwakensis CCY0110]|uniref:Uncharacterized protein n=1 Tax=Crocosphaera chwakensis CCY0110 TaxID=391612 RepID=A3IHK7_9CHRO|nr:hypothetical protein CY0110_15877 [Crocosphaera chwakensis CCY0110]
MAAISRLRWVRTVSLSKRISLS